MKMGSFLSVAKGSDEPLVFLEVSFDFENHSKFEEIINFWTFEGLILIINNLQLHYNHAPNTKPLVMVGKGITFDSGGISLKPSSNMDKMRGDMGGAANVVGTILTLAATKAAVNVIGLYFNQSSHYVVSNVLK